MLHRMSFVTGLLLACSLVNAQLNPKFDEEFLKNNQQQVASNSFLTLEAAEYDESLKNNGFNDYGQGTLIKVGQGSNRFVFYKLDTNANVVDVQQFSTQELGLNTEYSNTTAILVAKDDSGFVILRSEYNQQTYQYNTIAYVFTFDNEMTPTLNETVEVHRGSVYQYGYSIDNSKIAMRTSNGLMKVLTYDHVNHSIEVSHSSPVVNTINYRHLTFTSDNQFLLVVSSTYSGQTDCLTSFELASDSTINQVDSASCGNSSYSMDRALIDPTSNQVILTRYNYLSVMNVSNTGTITLVNHDSSTNLFGRYSYNAYQFDNGILTIRDYYNSARVNNYTIDAQGNFSTGTTVDFTPYLQSSYSQQRGFVGANLYYSASSNGLYSFINLNADKTVLSSTQYDTQNDLFQNGYYYGNSKIIPVSDQYFLKINSGSIALVDGSTNKSFSKLTSLQSSVFNDSYYFVEALEENKFLIISSSHFIVLEVNLDTFEFLTPQQGALQDENNQSIRIYSNYNDLMISKVNDNTLFAKVGGDRLAKFTLSDTDHFSFSEFYVDSVNNFIGAADTDLLFGHGNNLSLISRNQGSVHTYQYLNDELTLVESLESAVLQYSTWFTVGNKLLLSANNLVATYSIDNGHFELLSASSVRGNMTQRNSALLDENFIVSTNNQSIYVYLIDSVTGQLVQVDTLRSEDSNFPFSFSSNASLSYFNNALWYEGYSDRLISRLDFNRAPYFKDTMELAINVNEGSNDDIQLTDWIFDYDEEAITFSSDDLYPSMELDSIAGVISYDGSAITTGQSTFNVSDEREATTSFTFDFIFNGAPVLADEELVLAVNQYESIAIDLLPSFIDPEGDWILFSAELPESLSLTESGVLAGSFDNHSIDHVTVRVTDARSATREVLISVDVNGAPVASSQRTFTVVAEDKLDIDLNSVLSDPEGEVLSYTIDGLPNGASVTGSKLSGNVNEAGVYQMRIHGVDSKGAKNTVEIKLTVKSKKSGGALFFLLPLLCLLRRRRTA